MGDLNIDVFDMEVREHLPNWLTQYKRDKESARLEEIRKRVRAKNRAKHLAERGVKQAHDGEAWAPILRSGKGGRWLMRDADGATVALDEFNEAQHPRALAGAPESAGGRFVSATGGVGFVSPNVKTGVDLPAAIKGLTQQRERQLLQASHEIDEGLGLHGEDHKAIGAWATGAEQSVATVFEGVSFDDIKLASAMKAYLTDQLATLVFVAKPGGDAVMFDFEAKGGIDDIHKALLEDGLAFHTLIPHTGGATVLIADLDHSALAAVKKGAARYEAEVHAQFGNAEFVGVADAEGDDHARRDAAREVYAGVIESSGNPRARDLWTRIRAAYGPRITAQDAGRVKSEGKSEI